MSEIWPFFVDGIGPQSGEVEHSQLLRFAAVHRVQVCERPSHEEQMGKVRIVGPERASVS